MNKVAFSVVTPGVLKATNDNGGPEKIEHEGDTYFRFMDFFYIKNPNLDQLTSAEVSNLCRARAKFPSLITPVNDKVRELFKNLTEIMSPTSLLEIGAGRNPVFSAGPPKGMRYVLSDADSEVIKHHEGSCTPCYVFSEDLCDLPEGEGIFEVVLAVFVLHFPFHKSQLNELYKRLSSSGVIIANVYRRSPESRQELTLEMENSGFKVKKVKDANALCRDHEYWILGKEDTQMTICASTLAGLISAQQPKPTY